jgi:pyrrolidone-carboxylate peptidase
MFLKKILFQINRLEAKVMKKQLVRIGKIKPILLCVFLLFIIFNNTIIMNGTAEEEIADISGVWSGKWYTGSGLSGTSEYHLTQTDSSVSGYELETYSYCSANYSVSGSVDSNGTVIFYKNITSSSGYCNWLSQVTWTGALSEGDTKITGTYTSGGGSGTFALTFKINQPPNPPMLISPGNSTDPGPGITTLTPTFQWSNVRTADYYALNIYKYPYGENNRIFNSSLEYGAIYETTYIMPEGKLVNEERYQWNVKAHNSIGWSSISSSLFFNTTDNQLPNGNQNIQRRNIILTGFWPPTNEMIARFSTDPHVNNVWQGENWENSSYNIYSFVPKQYYKNGGGTWEWQYQQIHDEFLDLVNQLHPIAIIGFGEGGAQNTWTIENKSINRVDWRVDGTGKQPSPNPPDDTEDAKYSLISTLPVREIETALKNQTSINYNVIINTKGDPGDYYCGYLAYLESWYQAQHSSSNDEFQCRVAGWIHVKKDIPLEQCMEAINITIREVLKALQNSPSDHADNIQPGFEIIFVIGAIALVMFWKRKRIINH